VVWRNAPGNAPISIALPRPDPSKRVSRLSIVVSCSGGRKMEAREADGAKVEARNARNRFLPHLIG
jgi:hypothetical protein